MIMSMYRTVHTPREDLRNPNLSLLAELEALYKQKKEAQVEL